MAVDMNIKILIVDDYDTMRMVIKNLLRQLNFTNTEEASDGAEALEKLNKDKFDLIISDWNMEPMTGIQLLREVRANDNLSDIPFIMITAEVKSENVIAAKEAGVSNYIIKPFDAKTLKTKLVGVLGDF